jgi:hypothetical protein
VATRLCASVIKGISKHIGEVAAFFARALEDAERVQRVIRRRGARSTSNDLKLALTARAQVQHAH